MFSRKEKELLGKEDEGEDDPLSAANINDRYDYKSPGEFTEYVSSPDVPENKKYQKMLELLSKKLEVLTSDTIFPFYGTGAKEIPRGKRSLLDFVDMPDSIRTDNIQSKEDLIKNINEHMLSSNEHVRGRVTRPVP